jgi:phenylacetate-CoA ligase
MPDTRFPNRAVIAASQLEQLRSLVAELFPGNHFYAQKLNSAGITFDIASLADFSERFPFTTKNEIVQDQKTNPPFGTNLTYPVERYTRYHQTSGTAGLPLRWLDTAESWDWMVESWTEILRVAGARGGDRAYFAFSFGPFIGFWLAFEAATRLGCLCIPGGGLSSAARLRAILDMRTNLLFCTPTYAIRLAEAAAEEKMDLSTSPVRTLVVAGEPGGSIPAVRARLSRLWPGARIFDHHGMTETGPVTYECPAQPGVLHVIESAYYAEVIEPGGKKAVALGQTGELVLTTLGRTGSPLLRYRTGDLVSSGTPGGDAEPRPCVCGRYELALQGGILGRTDDMVVVRGVNVYPSAVEDLIRAAGGVAEYRVEISKVRALAELSVQVEPEPACTDAARLVKALEKSFEAALSLRVSITLVPVGTLPRPEMKSRRWVRR